MAKPKAVIYNLNEWYLRDIIIKRAEELQVSPYEIGTYSGVQVSVDTIYRFFRKDATMLTTTAEELMRALGIQVHYVETPKWVKDRHQAR